MTQFQCDLAAAVAAIIVAAVAAALGAPPWAIFLALMLRTRLG